MAATILPFFAPDTISAYLGKHPQTSRLDQRIIDAVAEFFADRQFADAAIDTLVQLKMEKMKIPQKDMLAIRINLTVALKDYANGKPIPLAKL